MKKEKSYHEKMKEPWEIRYSPSVKKDNRQMTGAQFNPMKSTDRMTTYRKVNETDH